MLLYIGIWWKRMKGRQSILLFMKEIEYSFILHVLYCMQFDGRICFSNHMSKCQLNLPVIRVIIESIHKPLSETAWNVYKAVFTEMFQRIELS